MRCRPSVARLISIRPIVDALVNEFFGRGRFRVVAAIALCFWLPALIQGQPPTPTPTPRPGRSYSADELPKTPPPPGPKAPSTVTFTDITAFTRINFKHAGSPTSVKYLLETMGGGVAIFDYDNDGRMDVFFTHGAALKDPMTTKEMPDKRDAK